MHDVAAVVVDAEEILRGVLTGFEREAVVEPLLDVSCDEVHPRVRRGDRGAQVVSHPDLGVGVGGLHPAVRAIVRLLELLEDAARPPHTALDPGWPLAEYVTTSHVD